MALTQLTKVDGRGINTTSDYRVGILTAVKFVGPFDGTGGNFAGVITATDGNFSGNVTIGGTLTYEDVTNIDSVGIITAKKDIHVGAGVSAVGVGTFGGGIFIDDSISHIGDSHTKIRFPTNDQISFENGGSESMRIYGYGQVLIGDGVDRRSGNAELTISGSSNVVLADNNALYNQQNPCFLHLSNANNSVDASETGILFHNTFAGSGNVALYSKKTGQYASDLIFRFRTGGTASTERVRITSSGQVKVGTGVTIETNGQATFTGIVTATTFKGDGDFVELDVDGHTNLDNVSIAGVTTFASGNVQLASDSQKLQLGSGQDLWMYHTGTSGGGHGLIQNDYGTMYMLSDNFTFRDRSTNHDVFRISQNNSVSLFYQNSAKLSTTSTGAQIDTILRLYGAAGTGGGRLRLAEGAAYSEIRGVRNSDSSSELWFGTEIGGTVDYRAKINTGGHWVPYVDSTYDLGLTGTRWRNVYADTYYGDGSNLTGIVADKIFEGNTEVETVDTGSDGHVKITTEGVESFRIDKRGYSSLGRDYSSNPSNGLVGITTIRGHRVNEAGDYAQLYFKNSSVSGGSSASIRAYRDGNNYSTGFSFYTRYSTSSGGDGNERFLINSTGTVVKQIFSSNQTYAANDTTQLGYQSQNVSDVTNTYTALRLTAGNSSPATAQLSSIRTGSGQNDFTIQLEKSNTAFEALRITSDGQIGIGTDTMDSSAEVSITNATSSARIYMKSADNADCSIIFGSMNDAATGAIRYDHSDDTFRLYGFNNSQRLTITSGGSVNIGGSYNQSTYKLFVNGSFAATTKSFVIDHPTKDKLKLRYACLEGPENSVYVRGKTSDSVIELPDYWTGLVHEDSITVNVTPIGNHKVWVESINNNSVTIGSDGSEYFYTVFAERKDVDKLEVEVEE